MGLRKFVQIHNVLFVKIFADAVVEDDGELVLKFSMSKNLTAPVFLSLQKEAESTENSQQQAASMNFFLVFEMKQCKDGDHAGALLNCAVFPHFVQGSCLNDTPSALLSK